MSSECKIEKTKTTVNEFKNETGELVRQKVYTEEGKGYKKTLIIMSDERLKKGGEAIASKIAHCIDFYKDDIETIMRKALILSKCDFVFIEDIDSDSSTLDESSLLVELEKLKDMILLSAKAKFGDIELNELVNIFTDLKVQIMSKTESEKKKRNIIYVGLDTKKKVVIYFVKIISIKKMGKKKSSILFLTYEKDVKMVEYEELRISMTVRKKKIFEVLSSFELDRAMSNSLGSRDESETFVNELKVALAVKKLNYEDYFTEDYEELTTPESISNNGKNF
jgi:hypothetical protein